MKTIIAGSRNITDYNLLLRAINSVSFDITEVVCGCADGPDKMGLMWARDNGIAVRFFPAWSHQMMWALDNRNSDEKVVDMPMVKNPKSAGFVRNHEMAKYAGAAIILWDGRSRGTEGMIAQARRYDLVVHLDTVSFL